MSGMTKRADIIQHLITTFTPKARRIVHSGGECLGRPDDPRGYFKPLAASHRLALEDHYRWIRSAGRFGRRYEAENIPEVFLQRDLDGACFENAHFEGTPFIWSSLRQVAFGGAELNGVIFKSCDLEQADFRGARLNDVKFINCFNVSAAHFDTTDDPATEAAPAPTAS